MIKLCNYLIKAIQEFKDLYKKHFNKEIDTQTALDKGLRLIRYMEVVLKEYYKIEQEEKNRKL
jgi:hypothetical protein